MTALPVPEMSWDENGGKKWTAHMLYEKDEWVFDTYSCRQYPKEEFMKVFGCPWEYGGWTYQSIQDMSYEDFRKKYGEDIRTLCESIECYEEFNKK